MPSRRTPRTRAAEHAPISIIATLIRSRRALPSSLPEFIKRQPAPERQHAEKIQPEGVVARGARAHVHPEREQASSRGRTTARRTCAAPSRSSLLAKERHEVHAHVPQRHRDRHEHERKAVAPEQHRADASVPSSIMIQRQSMKRDSRGTACPRPSSRAPSARRNRERHHHHREVAMIPAGIRGACLEEPCVSASASAP